MSPAAPPERGAGPAAGVGGEAGAGGGVVGTELPINGRWPLM